ncbi:MAG: hypothetical protein IPG34_15995 [Rhodocyclaceae bacterium]|nr:hypothetical protein [Rhodocyclaceae bacterium]
MTAESVPAARHPLTISIETSDSADLLTTTLDTTVGTAAVVHVHTWGERAIWLGAAVLAPGRRRFVAGTSSQAGTEK